MRSATTFPTSHSLSVLLSVRLVKSQQKKEAEAALALASYGVKTYQQITREFGGGDFMANAEELKRENDALEAAGAIEYEIPDTTDPSDLDAKHPEDR